MRTFDKALIAGFALLLALGGCGRKEEPAPVPTETPASQAQPAPMETAPEPASESAEEPTGDYADGLMGGPDFWAVTGADETYGLNLRSGPSGQDDIIGALANGDVVRNKGCQMTGDDKWCQVETVGDMPATGWVPGRFLRESAAP